MCAIPSNADYYALATARHVVEHANHRQAPIRLHHEQSGGSVLLQESDRAVITAKSGNDFAILLIRERTLNLLSSPINLLPSVMSLRLGTSVGWLGYPLGFGLSFFSGRISSLGSILGRHESTYLIDGVAINGVSGGPVFVRDPELGIRIVGSITAYVPNRATGEILPGLSEAQDIQSLHDTITTVSNALAEFSETQPNNTE